VFEYSTVRLWVGKMKALLALRSVGFCVGQSQMCLNVRWVFFFVLMQQKFLCHSVVGFCLFTMNGNGCGYVACPVGSGRCSYPPDKVTLKRDNFLIDQPWGMRCTRCWCLYFSSLSQSVLRSPVGSPKGIFARWLS